MKELTKENFNQEVMESNIPVLLDFWAPWCGPCKAMAPVLEEMSVEYVDKIKICKINIDEVMVSDFSKDFSVSAVPTLMIVKGGQVVGKEVGIKTKNAIKALVGGVL